MAQSFHGVAATWQNFYLLVGTAAATLAGLMFVAVTFGSELVMPRSGASVRSFLDPTFNHFAHVLFTAGLMVIPTMPPALLGSALLLVALARADSNEPTELDGSGGVAGARVDPTAPAARAAEPEP